MMVCALVLDALAPGNDRLLRVEREDIRLIKFKFEHLLHAPAFDHIDFSQLKRQRPASDSEGDPLSDNQNEDEDFEQSELASTLLDDDLDNPDDIRQLSSQTLQFLLQNDVVVDKHGTATGFTSGIFDSVQEPPDGSKILRIVVKPIPGKGFFFTEAGNSGSIVYCSINAFRKRRGNEQINWAFLARSCGFGSRNIGV
jgi:hypothetical protein